MSRTILAVLALAGWLSFVAPAGATEFYAGIGTSFNDDPAAGIGEAFDEAFKALGERPAKLVIVTENYTGGRQGRQLYPVIFEKAKAKNVPLYGAGLGAATYTAQSPAKGFLNKRSISVLALGGDFEYQVEMVKMGPVEYQPPNNNPTMIENRQKPAAEMARKFTLGADQNLLLVYGQLHNPEITYFANGLREVLGDKVTATGTASQGGCVYYNGEAIPSAAIGILIKGKFKVAQQMVGQYWDGKDLDKHFTTILKKTAIDEVPKPDLILGVLCGSWQERGDITAMHKALVDTLGTDIPYFGTFGGGELGKFQLNRRAPLGITGTGGCGVVTAIKGEKGGAATTQPATQVAKKPTTQPAK